MTDEVAETFSGLLGAAGVAVEQDRIVLHPATKEELVEVVRCAFREKIGLVPLGGGTSPRVRKLPQARECWVSTSRLDRIVEHAVEDLTFTAEAGLTIEAAMRALAPHRQCVPVSPSRPSRCSLGGLLARAENGPSRHAWGDVRDQLLGIEVVHGDGRVTKAGGRVVKNVTGYDLCRLYTGSRGVLGIIMEATWRLRALPPSFRTLVVLAAHAEGAWRDAMALRQELPDIFALHVLVGAQERLPGGGSVALVITLAGEPELVAALEDACREGHQEGSVEVSTTPSWLPLLQDPIPAGPLLRITTEPRRGGELLEILRPLVNEGAPCVMDVLGGITHVGLPAGWPESPDIERSLGLELAAVEALVDLPHDPLFHARRFSAFPSSRPEGLEIMSALRRTFDPAGILNPGRFEAPWQ